MSARITGAVTSFLGRASCLIPLSTVLQQKIFELVAQFVRLNGRNGKMGAVCNI
jgi:hypothetical protein